MLRGIDPVLNGTLLKALDELGHGDRVTVVDRNFPAYTQGLPVVDLGEISITRAVRAILSVYPLDTYVDEPLRFMQIADSREPGEVHHEIHAVAREWLPEVPLTPVERFAFYREASDTHLIVRCLENRPYANVILQKGVI